MCIALLYVKEERSKGHLPSTPSFVVKFSLRKGCPSPRWAAVMSLSST